MTCINNTDVGSVAESGKFHGTCLSAGRRFQKKEKKKKGERGKERGLVNHFTLHLACNLSFSLAQE